MDLSPISIIRMALLAAVATPSLVAASETIAYCSSQNTGSSFSAMTSTFQSYGLCQETCNADYAFAILQGHDCWCSNYAPSETTDTSSCSDPCPGYGSDLCGNTSEGLYVYYEMTNVSPSGTASASGSMTASKTQASSTGTSGTTSASSAGTTTKPTLSVQTIAGQPVTVTVQNPSTTGTTSADSSSHHSSLGGGAIAGIVVGSVAGVAILLALLFWFCYARRRSASAAGSYDPSIQGNLLDGARHSKGSQMSMMRNVPSSSGGLTKFTDSRMNKEATLYPNGARLSNVSLQDNQDYSRPVLRLTNPD